VGSCPSACQCRSAGPPRLAEVVERETRGRPLIGAILLNSSSTATEVGWQRVTGAQKLAAIHAAIEGLGQVSFGGRKADFFRWASTVADRLPMFRLTRPRAPWGLPEVLNRIEQALADPAELGLACGIDVRNSGTV
jgi:hypothetical protein